MFFLWSSIQKTNSMIIWCIIMHPSIGPMCLESDVPSLCLVFKSCHWGSWRWLVEISDLLKLVWVIIYFCTFLYLLYVFCSSYRKGNIQWMCLSRGNPGLTIPVHIFEMLGFCRAHPQGERLHQIWYIIVNYNIICYVYLYIYMTIIMIVCVIYYVDICVCVIFQDISFWASFQEVVRVTSQSGC